ncbi:MAG: NDP-sugar synthase [Candidatus Bathyarchaeia archaeon]
MGDYEPRNLWVIIPIGGLAKRLLPLTAEVSKACVRLANRSILEISLLCLARQGVKNFILGVKGYTNYKSLHDYFKEGIGFSARYGLSPRIHIKYQPNVTDLGSADSVRINLDYYDVSDPVLVVQGDNIFDLNLRAFIDFHRRKGGLMTIGLKAIQDVSDYGIAQIDEDMRILRFVEKPRREETPSNLANTGIYLLNPEMREILREEGLQRLVERLGRLDFGLDLIPYLIETGREVYGYNLIESWYDVGTPERYLEAMKDILKGRLGCLKDFGGRVSEDATVWVQGESPESIRRRERILEMMKRGSITLEGSVLIGRHCQIEEGAYIRDSCIDNFTKIGSKVRIEGSAIMDRVTIGEASEIRRSIVGRHVTVGSEASKTTVLENLSVIGDDVKIEPGCHLSATKVYPHLCIPCGSYIRQTVQRI